MDLYSSAYGIPRLHSETVDNFSELPSHLTLGQAQNLDVFFHAERVLSKRPDINRDWLNGFIEQHVATYGDGVVDFALSSYTDSSLRDGGPSSNQAMGKSKILASGFKADNGSEWDARTGYSVLAPDVLQADLSNVPENRLEEGSTFKSLYAPTHHQEQLFLSQDITFSHEQGAASATTNKGKGREIQPAEFDLEPGWISEEAWGRNYEVADVDGSLQQPYSAMSSMTNQSTGDKVDEFECGCCFSTFTLDHMILCVNNHPFCRACVTTHSESLLRLEKTVIPCISTVGCQSFFSDHELGRCLSQQLLRIRERLIFRKEIQERGLTLGECPFCDWICALGQEQAPELVCGNCGATSCMDCKRHSHPPKTCEEVREDEKWEGRHVVEEAMTSALIRRCPECKKPFIKEDGCNKITCPFCGTVSCYICRRSVKDGYNHFQRTARKKAGPSSQTVKCPLMDSVEERHATEVIDAATRAIEDVKRRNPDIKDDIWVDLPEKPPARRARAHAHVRHAPMAPALFQRQLPHFVAFQAPQFHVQPQPQLMAQPLPAQPGPSVFHQLNAHWAPHLRGQIDKHINGQRYLHNGPPIATYAHAHAMRAAAVGQAPPFVFGQNQYATFTAPFIRPGVLTMHHSNAPQDMRDIHGQVPRHGMPRPHLLQGLPDPQHGYPQHIHPGMHPVQVPFPAQMHQAPPQGRRIPHYMNNGQPNGTPQVGPVHPVPVNHHFPLGRHPPIFAPGYLNDPPAPQPQRWMEPQIQAQDIHIPADVHTPRAIQQGDTGEQEYYLFGLANPSHL